MGVNVAAHTRHILLGSARPRHFVFGVLWYKFCFVLFCFSEGEANGGGGENRPILFGVRCHITSPPPTPPLTINGGDIGVYNHRLC